MSLLDPALRRITSIREAEYRPYDRYGAVIPGLSWVPLSNDCETEGRGCYLLRFAPGAASRPHEHAEGEEFLVLDGVLEDSDGQCLTAGDFVSYQAGSRHFSTAPKGCTLLVLLASGNRPVEGA